MALNYKSIPYKTSWTEYPDLASTFTTLGIPPNDPSNPAFYASYTSPAIQYADGTLSLDSWLIAHALEQQYPSPSLHLDDPIVVQVRDHILEITKPLMPHLIPKVPAVLTERSAEYFYRTREVRFGAPLQEIERTKANEECWREVQGPVEVVGDWLRRNGGPFFLGETGTLMLWVLRNL